MRSELVALCTFYFSSNHGSMLDAATRPAERGGQKGVTVRWPGDAGGPGFRNVRFRMQNSSAQTTACGRDDVFLITGRNSNICGRYDVILLITRC